MNYKKHVFTFTTILLTVSAFLFLVSVVLFSKQSYWILFTLILVIFTLMFQLLMNFQSNLKLRAYKRYFRAGDTADFMLFIDIMRKTFTIQDLIKNLQEYLEKNCDASIIIDMGTSDDIQYSSVNVYTKDPEVLHAIKTRFSNWGNGCYFLDDKLCLISSHKNARGFFVCFNKAKLFVFTKLTKYFEADAFNDFYTEFCSFFERSANIEKMFVISALSKEWDLVADTQKSFLPEQMPIIEKIELASFFKPLVNVSGDYYDVIPIDEKRTLLVLGDVSGKGLASALIMGIILNTIRILEDKTNLVQLVLTIDTAIKAMNFEDKYTVLFLGILDTEEKKLSYVNASMADPLIISQSVGGVRIKKLESNCSLIGLIPIDSFAPETIQIRDNDVILIASDGASEMPNDEGVQLGDTEEWQNTLIKCSKMSAEEVINTVSSLVFKNLGDRKLKDDVTMLAVKVGKLWD